MFLDLMMSGKHMTIVIDIETVPKQGDSYSEFLKEEEENFKAPSSLNKGQAVEDLGGDPNNKEWKFKSKDDVIALWEKKFSKEKAPEVAEEKWRKTALDGSKGEIISIAYRGIDFDVQGIYRKLDEPEDEFLSVALGRLAEGMNGANPFFAGHNIAAFDLKFIYHRCVINKVKPPFAIPFGGYHGKDYFDNMIAWTGYRNDRISQVNLAKALGLPGKSSDIDGSKVWDFIRAGKYDEVVEYNKDDVNQAFEIYSRLNFF